MESNQPAEPLFLELLENSIVETRESAPNVASAHESYALLSERLELYWREVRGRRDPEVLLDLLVSIATQCAAAAEDLFVNQVLAANQDAREDS